MWRFQKVRAVTLMLLMLGALLLQSTSQAAGAQAAPPTRQESSLADVLQVTATATDITPTTDPPTATITPTLTLAPPTATITPTLTITPTATTPPVTCSSVMDSWYLSDQDQSRRPDGVFLAGQHIYLNGTLPEGFYLIYAVTGPAPSSGTLSASGAFSELVVRYAPAGRYAVRVTLQASHIDMAQEPCSRDIGFAVAPPCDPVAQSLYLSDQLNKQYPNNSFPEGQDVYLRGSLGSTLNYTVTNQLGTVVAGAISQAPGNFSTLLLSAPPAGQYRVATGWSVRLGEHDYAECSRQIDFAVATLPTIEPTHTWTPTPTHTPTPTATPLPAREEPAAEPETKITSIELQIANDKVWGLLVVENPRSGQSVTLNLQYRVLGPRAQQAGDDGFIPTGETTTIGFSEGQTHYNFSFDRPPGVPPNAEVRVAVAGQSGGVGGTNITSPPVSFDRPSAGPTAPTPPRPTATTVPIQPAPATATPAILPNVSNPSPTTQPTLAAQPAQPRPPAGTTAPRESGPREFLPQTASADQLIIPGLLLVSLLALMAAGWLLKYQGRTHQK